MRTFQAVLGALLLLVVGAYCAAQDPNIGGTFKSFTLNGNLVTAASGTNVVTLPATTETLLGTTTICTTQSWCEISVTLTDAQIKALPTTPIQLVAAAGSGYRIKPIGATFIRSFSAGAYTNVDATYSSLQLQDPNGDWLSSPFLNDTSGSITDLTSFFAASASTVDGLIPYTSPNAMAGWQVFSMTTATASLNNTALQIAMDNNGTGNLTGGNAANTLTVVLTYRKQAL